jgi:hypothetical protein
VKTVRGMAMLARQKFLRRRHPNERPTRSRSMSVTAIFRQFIAGRDCGRTIRDMERREEQMCYELERRLIGLLQKDDYQGCFSVVDDALANPDLDVHLTKAMLVPIAYNVARMAGDAALMDRYAQLREKLPSHRTRRYPDAT